MARRAPTRAGLEEAGVRGFAGDGVGHADRRGARVPAKAPDGAPTFGFPQEMEDGIDITRRAARGGRTPMLMYTHSTGKLPVEELEVRTQRHSLIKPFDDELLARLRAAAARTADEPLTWQPDAGAPTHTVRRGEREMEAADAAWIRLSRT